MKYAYPGILNIVLCLVMPQCILSQTADSLDLSRISEKYVDGVASKSEKYGREIEKTSENYLLKLKEQEGKINSQLSKIDPQTADRIFKNSEQYYDNLQHDLQSNADRVTKAFGKYIPGIDSTITSLGYLKTLDGIGGKYTGQISQIKGALSKVSELQNQFKKADNIEELLKQRQEYHQKELSSFKIPGLEKYNQQISYYSQQINGIKQEWSDPSKIEKRAVTILNGLPAFRDFMNKNSMIAGLFDLPDGYGTDGTGGLQTRDQVQQLIAQQASLLGPSGTQSAQKGILDAQSTLTSVRDKLNQGSSELSMPDGTNKQHTKSFLKRLEYGVNIQNSRASGFFPTTTNFAGTVAYRLNDRSSIGIGLSYNVGWGTDIRHIHISSQGFGLRSFLDVKIKGSFYATGGYERNYTKSYLILNQTYYQFIWQDLGLIGISKILSLKGNIVKKTKAQLLWNFISYYQKPPTQPFVFRLGYNF